MKVYNEKALDYILENYGKKFIADPTTQSYLTIVKVEEVECCFEYSYLVSDYVKTNLKRRESLFNKINFKNSKIYKAVTKYIN